MKRIIAVTPVLGMLAWETTAAPTSSKHLSTSSSVQKRQSYIRANNYSGAKLLSPPDGSTYTYVTTQISVPETIFVTAEGSPGSTQKSSAWVGFGGQDNGNSGILQTGCSFYNDGEGDTYNQCWYEFFPNPAVFYDGFSPSQDDTVLLELSLDSPTSGTSTITNLNTGEQVTAQVQAPDGHSVAGNDVEWIVENPRGASDFADFQTQFFEGCEATTAAGNTYGPGDGSYVIFNEFKDLGDGNGPTKWTNSFLPSDSEVQVDWTGPS